MTKTPQDVMIDMARAAGELAEAIVEQEAQMLHLVQAEMDALGNLVLTPPKAQDAKAQEAEIEAGFDNMPV